MAKIYRMENVKGILAYDEYIKDFEEQAAEYCKGNARSLLESLFAEFTMECEQGIYLSGEETKKGTAIRFTFDVYPSEEDGRPIVLYLGMQ